MKFTDKSKGRLKINDCVAITGIPPEAHEYVVNGRAPIGWFIDRYRITTQKGSGMVNDPTACFEDPSDLIAAFRRIAHVGVETVRNRQWLAAHGLQHL